MVSFMASGGYDKPSDKDRGERLDEKSKDERKRSVESGGRRTWNQNAVVAQIKSSDVEAVERTVCYAKREARERAKKMEKKFYEGLTGGLGRLTMYTRRYTRSVPPHPDPWTIRPTMYNVRRSYVGVSPGRRFWRRAEHKVTLDLVRHIRPSPSASRASFFFPRVPLGS